MIGPTGDPYGDIETVKGEDDVGIMEYIKNLASTNQLPKNIMKRNVFDDVRSNKPAFNEYYWGRHNNCNMLYFNQFFHIDYILISNIFHQFHLFSLDRQGVREIWTLFLYVPPSLADACYV